MRRVFISYAGPDSEAALYVTSYLRSLGVDVFIDYDRMMHDGTFTRRAENELKSRRCMIFIQSPEAMKSPLAQTELEYAYQQDIEIIPMVLKPLNVRETGEFRFLLTLKTIDMSAYLQQHQAKDALDKLRQRLSDQPNTRSAINVNNADQLKERYTLQGHSSWVREIEFSPDGYLLASSSNDNSVCIWDMRTAQRTGTQPRMISRILEHGSLVWGMSFSPTAPLFATGAGDATIRLWDLNSLPETYELTRLIDHKQAVYSVCFSQDGKLLASGSHDNRAYVYDIDRIDHTAQAKQVIPLLHAGHVYWVTFSPSNHLIATTSRDSAVRLWSYEYEHLGDLSKEKPRFLSGHSSWVNSATFSPNGLILASASHDTTIRLWDVETGQTIHILTGHQESVNTVAFSADGSLLASAAKDDTVRLWDLHSFKELAIIRGHQKGVNSVVFSPNGLNLVTGSGDTTIKFWGL
ncbi:MAG: TIR domain-containing protein [Anaerolineae bacterium]|jgi:WD40 repeat protein|nr:TIR domain-containing protein [Anaerolineae bacterium]